jgi:DNA mismatch endonuclease (patch repair protein)
MTDNISAKKRSWLMSRVGSKNTKPEIAVRSFLHRLGFRFRLHNKKLPGTPDMVLAKYKTAIFVNGCFWHGCPHCKHATIPKSHRSYWQSKLLRNKNRDKANIRALNTKGWETVTLWECELRDKQQILKAIGNLLKSRNRLLKYQKLSSNRQEN